MNGHVLYNKTVKVWLLWTQTVTIYPLVQVYFPLEMNLSSG